MNKSELIKAIHDAQGKVSPGIPTIEHVLDTASHIITRHLSTGDADIAREVVLPGLGKLVTVNRAERKGINPQTGESIDIPAKLDVKFKPNKALRDALNPEQANE